MKLYPKGDTPEAAGYLSVYLSNQVQFNYLLVYLSNLVQFNYLLEYLSNQVQLNSPTHSHTPIRVVIDHSNAKS